MKQSNNTIVLYPRQVEGVRFLYEATMGLRTTGMQGCILADDMVRHWLAV